MDGKFHRLTVRVKRPGVRCARAYGLSRGHSRGCGEARAAAMAAGAVKPVSMQAKAMEQPLAAIGIYSRERPLRVQVAAGYLPSGGAAIHVVAEVPATTVRHDWIDGGQADVTLIDSTGATVATETLTIRRATEACVSRSVRGRRCRRASIRCGSREGSRRRRSRPLETSAYRCRPLPRSRRAVHRRGITTGNQPKPTADLRFRRTERIVVEVPTPQARPERRSSSIARGSRWRFRSRRQFVKMQTARAGGPPSLRSHRWRPAITSSSCRPGARKRSRRYVSSHNQEFVEVCWVNHRAHRDHREDNSFSVCSAISVVNFVGFGQGLPRRSDMSSARRRVRRGSSGSLVHRRWTMDDRRWTIEGRPLGFESGAPAQDRTPAAALPCRRIARGPIPRASRHLRNVSRTAAADALSRAR